MLLAAGVAAGFATSGCAKDDPGKLADDAGSGGLSSGGIAGVRAGNAGAPAGNGGTSAGAGSGASGGASGSGSAAGGAGANPGGASGGGTTGFSGGGGASGSAGAAGTTALGGAGGGAGVAGSGGPPGSGGAAAGSGGESGGGAGGSGGKGGSGGITHTGDWRIMPLGDSITETTCQTQLLWKKLRDAGHTNFDLVGTRPNQQACNVTNPDRDCEGHGGYRVQDLVGSGQHASEPAGWFSTDRGEVVLMHFGTNDVWNSSPIQPAPILDAFSTVVDGLRAVNANVIVFVAQIIPMNPNDGCASCNANVNALNAAIPAWATGKATATSPIYVVDQNTGFDTTSDTGDGVHPNILGSQKMADRWFDALVAREIF